MQNQYFNIKTGVSNVTSNDGNQYFNVKKTYVWDPDAVLYLDNSGINDEDIRVNYNEFVKELKSGGVYHLIDVIYPDLGENADQNKLNAVNPIDDDSAFRRTFHGGVTFDSVNGTKGNGINGYYDTKYIPVDNMTSSTGGGISIDILSTDISKCDIGVYDPNGNSSLEIYSNWGSRCIFRFNSSDGYPSPFPSSRFTSIIYSVYKMPNIVGFYGKTNTDSIFNNSLPFIDFPSLPIFGLCHNRKGDAAYFSDSNQKGVIIYKNTTQADVIKIETALKNMNNRRI